MNYKNHGMTLAEQAVIIHREAGFPVAECRSAIAEANGDKEAAIIILRQRRPLHVDPLASPGFWDQFKPMARHNGDQMEDS